MQAGGCLGEDAMSRLKLTFGPDGIESVVAQCDTSFGDAEPIPNSYSLSTTDISLIALLVSITVIAIIVGLVCWCVQQSVTSVAVLAEIPVRSPRKLFNFISKKNICWVKVSKNKII